MGSKAEPGKHDAWDKALVDEPRFALLARDPLGPDLVRLWVALRDRDMSQAALCFAKLVGIAVNRLEVDRHAKLEEARECAQTMEDWRLDQAMANEIEAQRRVEFGGQG